jgi:uncharacterized protein (TIGR03790 family)
MNWKTVMGRALWIVVLAASAPPAMAGGGPQNVLVVVNDQSIESLQVGQYYRELRGIPERQVCPVSVDPLLVNVSASFFQTAILARVHQHIAHHGLSNQIDYLVLSKELPTRVAENEGATAVAFYGYKGAPFNGPCILYAGTESHYYKAERAFGRSDPYGGTNYYLSMMLTGFNLSDALSNVWRGAAADGTEPDGTFYLLKPPGDPNRNVRYQLFDNFDFHARFRTNFPGYQIAFVNSLIGLTDVLGYLDGLPNHSPVFWTGNQYRPGAMADHFTSYGARFPEPPLSQNSILEWIRAGATASYGTVNEPCSFLEKFPDPLNYYWLARGFNVAESYWMSVQYPYQGLFVGEPLAAPYARPPFVAITNLLSNQVVSGTVTVAVTAGAGTLDRAPFALDAYVDDLWVASLARVEPTAGNVLSFTLAGTTCTHVVTAGQTLYQAVAGLRNSINSSNLPVQAESFGDRLSLVYTNYGQSGADLAYSVATLVGTAAELTVWGEALSTNLLESVYPAREYFLIYGLANSGDVISCAVTLTNAVTVTNRIVAEAGETPASLMNRLIQAVNTNAVLQLTNGVLAANPQPLGGLLASGSLEARTPGPGGFHLALDYQVLPAIPGSGLSNTVSFVDQFNDNAEVLTARGQALFQRGRPEIQTQFVWNTAGWPDGPHTVRLVAREGTGVEAQGHAIVPVMISNSALACFIVWPTNGHRVALGEWVSVTARVDNVISSITQAQILVQQKVLQTHTAEPYTATWNSLDYGVGRVSVQARAFDGAGPATVSEAILVEIVMSPTLDSDGDGIADAWEQHYFGGLYVYGATHDPDRDGVANLEEFVADTDPTQSNQFLAVRTVEQTGGQVVVYFETSTNRLYQADYSDGFFENGLLWQPVFTALWPGAGATQSWTDDGTLTSPPPGQSTQRSYRIRAVLPPN